MKTLILITAFNVEKFIEKVILRLPKELKESQSDTEILIIMLDLFCRYHHNE